MGPGFLSANVHGPAQQSKANREGASASARQRAIKEPTRKIRLASQVELRLRSLRRKNHGKEIGGSSIGDSTGMLRHTHSESEGQRRGRRKDYWHGKTRWASATYARDRYVERSLLREGKCW